MIQLLPQIETLIPTSANPMDVIEQIDSYIEKYHCEILCVDISHMNTLDACQVSTLCSTTHYLKYPQGKIEWIVSSHLVREFNKSFELGNSKYFL